MALYHNMKDQEEEWVLSLSAEQILQRETKLSSFTCERLAGYLKNNYETSYIVRYKEGNSLTSSEVRSAVNAFESASKLNKEVIRFINAALGKVNNWEEKKALEKRLKAVESYFDFNEIRKEIEKPGKTKTKADEARKLGFAEPAQLIMDGEKVEIGDLCDTLGLSKTVVTGHLQAIIADSMNKSDGVKEVARQIARFELESEALGIDVVINRKKWDSDENFREKNRHFFDCIMNKASDIRDDQISSLNRASSQGLLEWSVTVNLRSAIRLHPCYQKKGHPDMRYLIDRAFYLSMREYFIPKIKRQAKQYLTEKSIAKGCDVFQMNTRQLFLTEGVKETFVIGLDPGAVVKAAFLNPSGEVIDFDRFLIHNDHDPVQFDHEGLSLLAEWCTETDGIDINFAVGDGKNSGNTVLAVQYMIDNKYFPSNVNVGYRVVSETGASKYSVSPEAEIEFPGMSPGFISAISIARRLIQPVEEYIKMGPKHLSLGQYQHSVNEDLLMKRRTLVIRDIVSMIGSNLNKASSKLLENICGLNEEIAKNIVIHRKKNGPFKSREELKKVEGVTEEVFEQASGFLTVKAVDGGDDWNPLDDSTIHPTNYDNVTKLLNRKGWTLEQLQNGFPISLNDLTEEEIKLVDLLTFKPTLTPAPRLMTEAPLSPKNPIGRRVTGVVTNLTEMGVFVDPRLNIQNCNRTGLIHRRHYVIDGATNSSVFEEYPNIGQEIDVIIEKITKDGKIFMRPV